MLTQLGEPFRKICGKLSAVLPVTVGGSPGSGGDSFFAPLRKKGGGDGYVHMAGSDPVRHVHNRTGLSDCSDDRKKK